MVEVVHPLFDDVDQDGAEGAVVGSLALGADEVGVEVAFTVARVLHQQAGTTQAAVHRRLEVVVVLAFPLAEAMGVQHCLHLAPGFFVHQGIMCSGVLHALEGDGAFVVGVAQHTMELGTRYRLGRLTGRRHGRQPPIVQVRSEPLRRPLPRRILRESQPDQWSTLLIERDGADLSSVLVSGADVDVTEWCLAQRPAVSGFLAHPLDDLIGQVAAVELGDAAHDAVQEHAARRLVDVLAGRDQPHTRLIKRPVYLHIVRSLLATIQVRFIGEVPASIWQFTGASPFARPQAANQYNRTSLDAQQRATLTERRPRRTVRRVWVGVVRDKDKVTSINTYIYYRIFDMVIFVTCVT